MEEKQLSQTVKKISDYIFKLMLFLAVFDGIRSRTPIAEYVTVFKEVSTFSLLGLILLTYTRSVNKKILYYSNLFFVLYILVIGTFVIVINDVSRTFVPMLLRKELPTPFAMHFKNIESFFVVFVLLHYEKVTGKSIIKFMHYFVYLCIIYILLTLLVYFYFPNTNFFQTPWYGRISIGYPTSDGQILAFALAYLVFGKSDFNLIFKNVLIVILLVGIVMNATATGLLAISIIAGGVIIYYFISGKIITLFSVKNLLYITSLFFILFVGKKVIDNLNDKMGNYPTLLDTKIGFITTKVTSTISGSGSAIKDIDVDFSEQMRKTQIEQAFNFNNDLASMLLGGPISLGTLIENENYFLIRSYGYLGFILYYAWILLLLMAGLRNIRHEYAQVLTFSIGILVITNSAIATTYLYGVAVSFGLIVSYYYTRYTHDKEEFCDDVV